MNKWQLELFFHSRVKYQRKLFIELDSNEKLTYLNLGNVYRTLNNREKALENYNKTIELDPNDSNNYFYRSVFYNDLEETYVKALIDKNIYILERCLAYSDAFLTIIENHL